MKTDGDVRCPSCGATSPPDRPACGNCGADLTAVGGKAFVEGALPEEMPRPALVDRSQRPSVPVEHEGPRLPGGKKLLEPGDEIRVDRADMVERETYQCLICGSTVPKLADKCQVCGTIFLSETEAPGFTGIPVARVPRKGELDAARDREVPLVEESVKLELPLPRPLSACALKEADVLPVMEPSGPRKLVVKKRVLKKARETGNRQP